MNPPKLRAIKPRRLTKAQKELHAANNVFNTPALRGFFIVAWDKDGTTWPCLYSPDKTLDEILALCMLKINEANMEIEVTPEQ